MRDKMVAFYLVFVALQVPLYVWMGSAPLQFDFKIQAAERQLRTALPQPQEQNQVELLLNRAEGYLDQMDDRTSRRALLQHERGVLAWKRGKSKEAMADLERAKSMFEKHHGPDSFHAHAVDLRIAELDFLRGNYEDALERFQRSTQPVSLYMGVRAPFPVRMKFRQVSSLVALGREEEASKLARESLDDLRATAGEQDVPFLDRTCMALDMLSIKGLIPPPPGGTLSWKPVLTEDRKKIPDHEVQVSE